MAWRGIATKTTSRVPRSCNYLLGKEMPILRFRRLPTPARGSRKVDLLRPVELVHEHLTAALCLDVYRKHRVRERERERIWTLARLAAFWIQVELRAP